MKDQNKSFRLAWVGLAAAALVILVLPPVLPPFYVSLITLALIYGLVATSLDILIGYTMMPSLGHGAYFALGAYTAAIMNTKLGVGFWATLPVSILVAACFAAILGLVAMRAVGVYFLMITLAAAMCVWGLVDQWVDFTGGENGLSGITRIGFGLDLNGTLSFHYFTSGFYLVCVGLIYLIIKSPFGRTLVGIRDSASRMQVLGYNVWLHKYMAFIIAAMFAGMGGCLYAYFNKFVGPDDADLAQCMEFFLMVSMGGQGTLIGPNIGAFIIVFLKNLASIYTDRWVMILAAIYILAARFAPKGILGLPEQLREKKKAEAGK
jgi:branched-chain amino acid transport system permease protein